MLFVQVQVNFCLAPPGYCPHFVRTIDMRVDGSSANQRYISHYRELFDEEGEKPISTWPTLVWILEDYELSQRRWQLIWCTNNKADCGPSNHLRRYNSTLNFVLAHVDTSGHRIRPLLQWSIIGRRFRGLLVSIHQASVERRI